MKSLLSYVFLLVNILLAFHTFFEAQKFFYNISALIGMSINAVNLTSKIFAIVFGLLTLGLIVFFESRYRKKEKPTEALRYFFVFSGFQLLLLATLQAPFFFTLGYRMGSVELFKYLFKPILGSTLVFVSLKLHEHSHGQ
ncbi:hypothetical protein [Pseudothermotoga sp.]|uniref:hypothetical protein n=1 Tax=Pseudothermotoga sp. TaxID=2033661 RepID=UPI0031F6A5D1